MGFQRVSVSAEYFDPTGKDSSVAAANGDLSSMIAEARAALREADGKLRALSTSLKLHQKQFKLVRSTLTSLQQLQGIKAA